jgi:hypothetical protein
LDSYEGNKLIGSYSRRRHTVGVLIGLLLVSLASAQGRMQRQNVNVAQRATIAALKSKIKQASRFYRAKKNDESAQLVREIEATLTPLMTSKDPAVVLAATSLMQSVEKSKQLLKVRGINFEDAKPQMAGNDAETVSFTKLIAPVLVDHCVGCHGNDTSRAGLNLQTFEGIQQGGNSGTLRVPAQTAATSLLVGKLRGTADGEQMPLGEDPLPEATIKLFEAWLNNGAPFDGAAPSADLESLINESRVKELSYEQLAKLRSEKAIANWKLGMPGIDSHTVTVKELRWVGMRSEASLKSLAEQCDPLLEKLKSALQIPENQKLLKGGMTVFVLDRHYDYSEFGRMVESRKLPRTLRGHWQRNGVDAYAAIVDGKEDYSLPLLVIEQVAAITTAGIGDVPDWFATGTGRALVARLNPKSPRVIGWREAGKNLRKSKPDDFLNNRLSPQDSALISYVFVDQLMKSVKSYRKLLGAIRSNVKFDQAFSTAYGVSPAVALRAAVR